MKTEIKCAYESNKEITHFTAYQMIKKLLKNDREYDKRLALRVKIRNGHRTFNIIDAKSPNNGLIGRIDNYPFKFSLDLDISENSENELQNFMDYIMEPKSRADGLTV